MGTSLYFAKLLITAYNLMFGFAEHLFFAFGAKEIMQYR